MDDDLFASFNQPPPPPNAQAAGDALRAPAVDEKAKKSTSKGSKGSKGKGKDKAKDQDAPASTKTKAPKRPLSPQDPPVDADSLKKLKQDTLENRPTASSATGEPFSVTDEIEITAQTTVKPSAGFTTTPAQPTGDSAASAQQHEEEGLVLQHQVRHQVALPPNYPYVPISQHVPPAEPARTYPFELDPFQKVSVASIQRNESVLVSAHTSAGKTVVAEYAIAQCLKQGQRVVYTSPIKVRPFRLLSSGPLEGTCLHPS